jgi:hypothetical protein
VSTSSDIPLFDVAADAYRTGSICDAIGDVHLQDFETSWAKSLGELLSAIPGGREESSHWNWRMKVGLIQGQLSNKSFAIECEGNTQGLMIVNLLKQSRLAATKGKPLVYVDFLETAPWNRESLTIPRYRGVGSVMLAAAIQLSMDEGFRGRVGLHSLPQSEAWYIKRGMTALGPDPHYPHNLSYFEMTDFQASAHIRGAR